MFCEAQPRCFPEGPVNKCYRFISSFKVNETKQDMLFLLHIFSLSIGLETRKTTFGVCFPDSLASVEKGA